MTPSTSKTPLREPLPLQVLEQARALELQWVPLLPLPRPPSEWLKLVETLHSKAALLGTQTVKTDLGRECLAGASRHEVVQAAVEEVATSGPRTPGIVGRRATAIEAGAAHDVFDAVVVVGAARRMDVGLTGSTFRGSALDAATGVSVGATASASPTLTAAVVGPAKALAAAGPISSAEGPSYRSDPSDVGYVSTAAAGAATSSVVSLVEVGDGRTGQAGPAFVRNATRCFTTEAAFPNPVLAPGTCTARRNGTCFCPRTVVVSTVGQDGAAEDGRTLAGVADALASASAVGTALWLAAWVVLPAIAGPPNGV